MNRTQRRSAEKGSKFAMAVQMHQSGRLVEAEVLYRKAIAGNPMDATSLGNLGLIAFQSGRLEEAKRLFSQATRVMPGFADAHINLGGVCRNLGQLDEAADSLNRALVLQPANAHAHTLLGEVMRSQQRSDTAIGHFRAALAQEPQSLVARFQLAGCLIEQREPAAAVPILTHLLTERPELPEVWSELGLAYERLGQTEQAYTHYLEALRLQPGFWVASFNLSGVLQHQGRLSEALAYGEATLRQQPDLPLGHIRRAQILVDLGQLAEANASFTKALDLSPEEPEALHGLGSVLQRLGRHQEAIGVYQRAMLQRPGSAAELINFGQALQARVELDRAIEAFAQAVRLEPGRLSGWFNLLSAKMHAADWTDLEVCERHLAQASSQGPDANPFVSLMVDTTPGEQLAAARQRASSFPSVAPLPRRPPHAEDRIRIGYLSADFYKHATAFLMTGVFESHDRSRFETFAYCIGRDDGSDERKRLRVAFDGFTDLSAVSHEQAAQRIHADRIDILVDLKGYTHGARPDILAYRPAPIQVNYLGYPASMGNPAIDYIMVDKVIVPPAMAPFFSEELVYLPDCYQPNMRRPIAPLASTRADHALPDTAFVFGCFNQAYKITPPVFDVWMRLLHSVPDSVLWLLNWNRLATANLQREAAARGIDPSRLIFGPVLEQPEHLARIRHADLCLDTRPYCAHTTASDTLWGGVPLVSCMNKTFVSRVSGSLLTTMGLTDLITETLAEYEAVALRLARDRPALAAVRRRVQDACLSSSLFDTQRTTRHIEAAFSEMWRRHASGMRPEAFAVNPLAEPSGAMSTAVQSPHAVIEAGRITPLAQAPALTHWTVIVPLTPDYIHVAALQEVVDAVVFGLRQLDQRVSLSHSCDRLPENTILIGAHLLSPGQCDLVPKGSIVYNTEHANSEWMHTHYPALLSRVVVWDYSMDNAQLLESRLGRPVHYVPLGYVPELSRITACSEQDIDVLFYGSLSKRRTAVFDQIRSSGLRFHHAFGVYGQERDALIRRAKIVLNVHARLPGAFESVRVSYLLANRKAVVSEVNPNERIDADLHGGFVAVPYENIAATLVRLAADEAARDAVAEAGFRQFSSRDQAGLLHQALGDRIAGSMQTCGVGS